MDAILKLVSDQVAAVIVGAIITGGPIVLVLLLNALKEAAKKTPNKLDDEIVARLLSAAHAKGQREALEGRDGGS